MYQGYRQIQLLPVASIDGRRARCGQHLSTLDRVDDIVTWRGVAVHPVEPET